MKGYQRVIVAGHLGQDAEWVNAGQDGGLKFSVAVTEKYKKRDGTQVENTEWFRSVLWGPRARGLFDHLTKGTAVILEGKLKTRKYDKEGQTHYAVELVVDELHFAGTMPRHDGGGGGRGASTAGGGGGSSSAQDARGRGAGTIISGGGSSSAWQAAPTRSREPGEDDIPY